MRHLLVIRSLRSAIPLWRFLCIDLVVASVVLALLIYVLKYHLGVHLPRAIVRPVNIGVLLIIVAYGVWIFVSTWRCSRHSHVVVRWMARAVVVASPLLLTFWQLPPTPREQVTQGHALTDAYRMAIFSDCSDGTMKRGTVRQFHERHGLPETVMSTPTLLRYSVVGSVSAHAESDHQATITMVFDAPIYDVSWPIEMIAVAKGMTLTYKATCTEGKLEWVYGGTVPNRYRLSPLRSSY
jgi:hypothetical protein